MSPHNTKHAKNSKRDSNFRDSVSDEKSGFRQFILAPLNALDYRKVDKIFGGKRAAPFSFFYQWFWWLVFGISMLFALSVWSIRQAKVYLPIYAPKLADFSEWFLINVVDELSFSHFTFSKEGLSTDLTPQPTDLIFYYKGVGKCFPDSLEKQVSLVDKRQLIVIGCKDVMPYINIENDENGLKSILPWSFILTIDTHKDIPQILEGSYAIVGVGKRYVLAKLVDPMTNYNDIRIWDLLEGVEEDKAVLTRRISKEDLSFFLSVDIPATLLNLAKTVEREGTFHLLIKILLKGVTIPTLLGALLPLILLGAVIIVLVQRFLMGLSSFIVSGVWKLVDVIFKIDRYTSLLEEAYRVRILLYWVNGVYLAMSSLVLFLGVWFPDVLAYVMDILFHTLKWWFNPFGLFMLGLIMLLLVNAKQKQ